MFSHLHIFYPGVLYVLRVSRVYKSWRQRSTISANTRQQAYPLAITILEHLLKLLLLKQPFAEDPLLSANSSNHEAFLVHIVGMLRLHFVEVNLATQLFKVHLVLITRVSSVALAIYRSAPLGCKLIIVSVEEASNLALRDRVSSNIRRVILHYFSCRR
jgi:hypothetical protein